MTREDEIAEIEVALDALLKAAMRADDERDGDRSRSRQVAEGALDWIDATDAGRAALELYAHPVAEACRQAIRTLGRRLHELGGVPLMQDVCQRVADADPDHWQRRTAIMDHRWDGIGSWFA